MRPVPAVTIVLLLTALALALAGCGSGGTQTVSVSNNPGSSGSAGTAATTTRAQSGGPKTTTTESTKPASTQTSRTGTAPAFTKETPGGESPDQAVTIVKAHGYTPDDPTQYHPSQTLRVLVATRTGSADGYAQQAFFFVDGRYIGTDTSSPSAGVKLVSQSDTEVTLAYRLYRPGDPLCCARGGESDVRFQLNNGRLVALDPIPPVSSSTGTSRQ